jgi:hypothetical protein
MPKKKKKIMHQDVLYLNVISSTCIILLLVINKLNKSRRIKNCRSKMVPKKGSGITIYTIMRNHEISGF